MKLDVLYYNFSMQHFCECVVIYVKRYIIMIYLRILFILVVSNYNCLASVNELIPDLYKYKKFSEQTYSELLKSDDKNIKIYYNECAILINGTIKYAQSAIRDGEINEKYLKDKKIEIDEKIKSFIIKMHQKNKTELSKNMGSINIFNIELPDFNIKELINFIESKYEKYRKIEDLGNYSWEEIII